MKKVVRQDMARKTMADKLREAMAKKPTASSMNKQGIPADKLPSLNKLPEDKQKLVKQNVVRNNKNQKRKFNNKPATASPVILRQSFEPPSYKEFETPDWFRYAPDNVDVSIIIPCFKSKNVLEKQIESWDLEGDGLTKEIIYVDDGCPDKSWNTVINSWEARKNELKHGPGRVILCARNGGFAFACNTGAKFARGKYLVFLNADTTVTKNWVRPMFDCLEQNPDIGIVGNLHLKKDGIVDSIGSEWDWATGMFTHVGRHIYKKKPLSKPFHQNNVPQEIMVPHDVEMVTGACFMIPKRIFHEIKGFDLEYRTAYWEDADINMKVHCHGYRVHWIPNSIIYHSGNHSQAGGHPFMNHNRALFHNKWVESKILHGYLDETRPGTKKLDIPQKEIVIYTAICNGYDSLKEQPPSARNGVDFVAFTDSGENTKTWDVRPVCKDYKDPNRNAKIHKILSHQYFTDKRYSLWIDGSITIDFPFAIEKLIEMYLADHDIAVFKHPDRNCVYQEANACLQQKLDDPNIIRKQIQKYTKEGYPSNAGLAECTVILRRHTDTIKRFNEAWWDEIRNGSRRDQISFNYVAKKLNVKIRYFPGNLRRRNFLFVRGNHESENRRFRP